LVPAAVVYNTAFSRKSCQINYLKHYLHEGLRLFFLTHSNPFFCCAPQPVDNPQGRFSGSPAFTAAFPALVFKRQWHDCCKGSFLKGRDDSGGTAPDLHGIPS